MNNDIKSVVASLGGTDEEITEYLPYLLQDLWELGGGTAEILEFLEKNLSTVLPGFNVLELCCGKGAVLLSVINKFRCIGSGIDLFEPFIKDAIKKAGETGLSEAADFKLMDIVDAVKSLKDFDLLIYGSDTDVLGDDIETLLKIRNCCKPSGYILYETAKTSVENFCNEIEKNRFEIIDISIMRKERVDEINSANTISISKRANELINNFPAKRILFENYIRNQQTESNEFAGNLIWFRLLLKLK